MIQLIKENEKLIFEFQDAKIFYRRIPRDILNGFVSSATTRRGTDWGKVTHDAMEHAILSWEGFSDGDKEVSYQPILIDTLPGAVIEAFVDVILEGRGDKVLKNSKPTLKAG